MNPATATPDPLHTSPHCPSQDSQPTNGSQQADGHASEAPPPPLTWQRGAQAEGQHSAGLGDPSEAGGEPSGQYDDNGVTQDEAMLSGGQYPVPMSTDDLLSQGGAAAVLSYQPEDGDAGQFSQERLQQEQGQYQQQQEQQFYPQQQQWDPQHQQPYSQPQPQQQQPYGQQYPEQQYEGGYPAPDQAAPLEANAEDGVGSDNDDNDALFALCGIQAPEPPAQQTSAAAAALPSWFPPQPQDSMAYPAQASLPMAPLAPRPSPVAHTTGSLAAAVGTAAPYQGHHSAPAALGQPHAALGPQPPPQQAAPSSWALRAAGNSISAPASVERLPPAGAPSYANRLSLPQVAGGGNNGGGGAGGRPPSGQALPLMPMPLAAGVNKWSNVTRGPGSAAAGGGALGQWPTPAASATLVLGSAAAGDDGAFEHGHGSGVEDYDDATCEGHSRDAWVWAQAGAQALGWAWAWVWAQVRAWV